MVICRVQPGPLLDLRREFVVNEVYCVRNLKFVGYSVHKLLAFKLLAARHLIIFTNLHCPFKNLEVPDTVCSSIFLQSFPHIFSTPEFLDYVQKSSFYR